MNDKKNRRKTYKRNERLSQARTQNGWTQRHLANLLHADEQTVRSWERGSHFPGIEFRRRLCELFHLSPEELGLTRLEPSAQIEEEHLIEREKDQRTRRYDLHEANAQEANGSSSPDLLSHQDHQRDESIVSRFLHQELRALLEDLPLQYFSRREDENRQWMLQRVHRRWMTGVLDRFPQAFLLRISMREQPDAVAHPWLPGPIEQIHAPQSLPAGISIMQVYDHACQELLILGEPGAGKSTLLLELTRDLIRRAKLDSTYPIPVIFQLSSWGQHQQSIPEWLVEELNTKYQVPQKLASQWVMNDQILPLLDGLDEVPPSSQTACIETINQYHKDHGLVPLVVCSRSTDYLSQSARLILNTAVMLQPLTSDQIDAYMSRGGESFTTMRTTLHNDPSLHEMVSNPLMLSVVTQAYQGRSLDEILTVNGREERRRIVFEQYVKRVLQRKKGKRYSEQQTEQWLAWLAQQMQKHNQTEFYIERMQPDWLEDDQRNRYRSTVMRMVCGLNLLVVAGLFACFRSDSVPTQPGLFYWLGGKGLGNSILGWMAPGLGESLRGGTSLALLIVIVGVLVELIVSHQNLRSVPWSVFRRELSERMRSGLVAGIVSGGIAGTFLGLFSSILYSMSGGIEQGLYRGIGQGMTQGLTVAVVVALANVLSVNPQHDSTEKYKPRMAERLKDYLIYFLCGCVGLVSIYSLESHGFSVMIFLLGLIIGMADSLIFGLGNLEERLYPGLGQSIEPAEIVTWSWEMVRRDLKANLTKGLFLILMIAMPLILVIGCASAFFYGPAYGLRYGLVYGSIVGIVNGVAAILAEILNSGWSSNILEDKHINTPNEGIRNSWRHACFAAGLFGGIGGIVSGITSGVSFWIGGVPGWSTLLLGFTLVCSILFAFLFWMAYGGIAVIEHYVLRWYLYRAGLLPWKYVPFLDESAKYTLLRKVGGGYMFSHRLLLDYFASLKDHSAAVSNEKKTSRK